MAKHNVRFSQIVSAVSGTVGFKNYKTILKQVGSRGFSQSSKAKDTAKTANAKNVLQQARKAMEALGYNQTQIHHYLIKDDPRRAGITDRRTAEKIINHMHQQGVLGKKRLEHPGPGASYGQQVLEKIEKFNETQKPADKKSKKQAFVEESELPTTKTSEKENKPVKRTSLKRLDDAINERGSRPTMLERYRISPVSNDDQVSAPKPTVSVEIKPESDRIANPNEAKDLPLS